MSPTYGGAPNRSRAAAALRLTGGAVAVGSMLALVAGVGGASATPTDDQAPHKSYVCKYVTKPGEAETLQSGRNPIWTDNHSLLGYDGTVTVGQQFKDGQFRSVVIVANAPKDPEPPKSACLMTPPPSSPPPSTTTTKAPPPPPPSTTTTKAPPPSSPPPSTTTTKAPPPPPPSTTTTKAPPPSTTTTKTPPPSTTTTTVPPPSTVTTYPLQPVSAGVTTDPGAAGMTPGRIGLVMLALLGVAALLGGLRFPRLRRIGSPKE
jgi:outer membrane biosynthesis protein TonB